MTPKIYSDETIANTHWSKS